MYPGLMQAFSQHVAKQPEAVVFKYKEEGKFIPMSYRQAYEKVEAIASWLTAKGVGKGDRVAILSENSVYWALADLAIISLGAISVAIYPTLTPRDVHYIIQNSGSTIVFVQDLVQLEKVLSYQKINDIAAIVVMNNQYRGNGKVVNLQDVMHYNGSKTNIGDTIQSITADDPICIIYTSGTTGPPKGVVLTHGNIAYVINTIAGMIGDISVIKESLSFLPLSHALERIAGLFFGVYLGKTVAFAESLNTILADMQAIKPTHAIAVPRVFEKIFERVVQMAEKSPIKKKIFWWSVKIGRKWSEVVSKGQNPGLLLQLRYAIARSLIFKKITKATGGRLKYFVSGGAPLSKQIAEFFHAADILVLEGWGATELSAPATWNSPHEFKFGSVGKPLPGVEVVVADDGELLVRGPIVFKEYWGRPEATAEAKDSEGWYHTGDIGYIDKDGWVYITDRKKELIINAAGKNISPLNIESTLKQSPYISNVMVYGDRRKYITALVNIDRENVLQYCREKGIAVDNHDLTSLPVVQELIGKEIERLNKDLARFEQVKKFTIIPEDFSVENDMLTPTLKLKRKNIIARYKEAIDAMYEGELLLVE
ncbi:MAG: long-chain fatty acid--CoA ligase [Spirochaetes bacterium]|nr:long-chain fatty acid--CoA ligase [Spirochaetota bacterium]